MSEPLIEVPSADWASLRDSFRKYEPFGLVGYNLIETQISMDNGRDCKFRVFCPYGRMGSGIVAFIEKDKLKQLVIISSYEGTSKLEEALLNTSLIDWPKGDARIEVAYAEPGAQKCIATVLKEKHLRKSYEGPTNLHCYTKGTLFEYSSPPEAYIAPVKHEHVPRINEVWPHRYESSEWVFDLFIKRGLSYGLYNSKTHALMAWIFVCEAGFLTHLYCEEEYRKRGYAELLIKHVTNERLKKGMDTFCYILVTNAASHALFKKVGFEILGLCCWMGLCAQKRDGNLSSRL